MNSGLSPFDKNKKYSNSKLKSFNCYAYALGYEDRWIIPGGKLKNKVDILPAKFSVDYLRAKVLEDLGSRGRILKGRNSNIDSNEYRVAMRVTIEGKYTDFHFMKQHSDGTWSHKQGDMKPESLGAINPDKDKYWNGYYSKTLYIAIKL